MGAVPSKSIRIVTTVQMYNDSEHTVKGTQKLLKAKKKKRNVLKWASKSIQHSMQKHSAITSCWLLFKSVVMVHRGKITKTVSLFQYCWWGLSYDLNYSCHYSQSCCSRKEINRRLKQDLVTGKVVHLYLFFSILPFHQH